MKNTFFKIFTLIAIIFTLQSCNEEINLIGEFDETAVVYGILDQSDSVHMIKITRAFIGPGDALSIANNPDSSYFQNVDATIIEKINGVPARSWSLTDTTILNKDTIGIFYAPEQKVYCFYTPSNDPLLGNATYHLEIDINNGEFQVSGETEMVSGISTNTDGTTYSFKFYQNGDYKTTTIGVNVGTSYRLNTKLEIHYDEFIGLASTPNSFTWNLGEADVQPGSNKTFVANGNSFYDLFGTACSTGDPSIDKRNITGITMTAVGGAEDLYNYILVNQPSSSVAQTKPTYTNLVATNDHNVIGVFTSRLTYSVYHPFTAASQFVRCLDKQSTQELCVGVYTNPYFFCSQHSVDIAGGETWACN